MDWSEDYASPGEVIYEHYEVVESLGTGSNGLVYLVRSSKDDALHAMKIFRAQDLAMEEARKRFEREALALSRLSHDNLVTLHEFGVLPDGKPFYVAEYVDGTSLEKLLDREVRLELQRLSSITLQVCAAMDYAHSSGIVHRDLKPRNILLTNIPGCPPEQVRIIDFGLVKFIAEESSDSRLTQEGTAVGSPAYMSPEQCKGKGIDCRSDVYSLGCIMYELLTGQPPFNAPYPMAIMMKQVSSPVEKPSAIAGDAEIDPAIEEIVLKCLEKSPSDRYQSMAELAAELEVATEKAHRY
ncbi:MAG: serine/threonine protein kinase [Candidatus Obscuribacterales bacterium]|nr:serine/threonine protein kinase [Candidatus Obscuribacterales bacterium]